MILLALIIIISQTVKLRDMVLMDDVIVIFCLYLTLISLYNVLTRL